MNCAAPFENLSTVVIGMLFRLVALSVLVIWLGVNVTGAAGDDSDTYSGPSIMVANNQDAGDDGFKSLPLAFLATIFHPVSPIPIVHHHATNTVTVSKAVDKPFELNCSFLL